MALSANIVSDFGAVPKVKKIECTGFTTTSTGTGFYLPAKAIVTRCWIDVRTVESTGSTKTVDVGIDTNDDRNEGSEKLSYLFESTAVNIENSLSKIIVQSNTLTENQNDIIKSLSNMVVNIKNLDNKFNAVYLITCDELEANRKYIIGKAKDLLNRLSQYNKMSNYKVVYFINLIMRTETF